MQKNGKATIMKAAFIAIAALSLSFAARHEFKVKNNKDGKRTAGPIVILKFDDLSDTGVPWSGFKAVTDLCKSKGVKCTVGIFGQTLERGDTNFLKYIGSIVHDPDIEIWMHGYNGAADELLNDPVYQAWAFKKTRWNLVRYFDYLPRTFSPHWKSGDTNTVKVFLADPFYLTWPLYPPAGNFEGLLNCPCQLEFGDSHYPDDLSKLINNYDACALKMNCFIFQGHPWAWDDAARNAFSQFIDYMKSKGARFSTFYEYYKITHHIEDTTPPSVPEGLTLTRNSAKSISLSWEKSRDAGSAVDGYKIFRNGIFVDIVPGTKYTDDAGENLSDADIYRVSAVNRANLVSAESQGISLSVGGTHK
jgi:peptidoglycan/xylan/chitin deacetylase (PgdA/CDA1 family)